MLLYDAASSLDLSLEVLLADGPLLLAFLGKGSFVTQLEEVIDRVSRRCQLDQNRGSFPGDRLQLVSFQHLKHILPEVQGQSLTGFGEQHLSHTVNGTQVVLQL